jgi:glycosyltransferase involved in cell wall biosynthesis
VYRIALVSREVYPFSPAEFGAYVTATARVLAQDAEVTVVTTDTHEKAYSELRRRADWPLPESVRLVFVPEPDAEPTGFFNACHQWSVRVYETLKRIYPDGGPELVEFPDVLAAGVVAIQAKQTLDPALRRTRVAVRASMASQMRDVLNGFVSSDNRVRTLYDLERYSLKYADCLLWPGGDVLGAYQRFFGARQLAPARLIRQAGPELRESKAEFPAAQDSSVRFLYMGSLERRKGVLNLMRAATALERDDWSLTFCGDDTRTGPFGVSMRSQLELMAADDERIEFLSAPPGEELHHALERHHAVVVPSLWDVWPLSALGALASNRPVLATPVGGLLEFLDGESDAGWLATDVGETALRRLLDGVLQRPSQVEDLIREGGPHQTLRRVVDPEQVREGYDEVVKKELQTSKTPRTPQNPLVSAVVPYYQLEQYVAETIASLFEQTHTPLEVIIVNDGSFREEDMVLEELSSTYPIVVLAQANSGLGAARNLGIRQARGRYVFPLDADNLAMPTFVERCVEVLESNEAIPYVTAWSRFVHEEGMRPHWRADGYRPLSNDSPALAEINTAGDAAAVIRRGVFERGFWYSVDGASSYEDWLFYRTLATAGLYGHVVPDYLLVYRVRESSMLRKLGMPHHQRLIGEMEAHVREREVNWTTAN